MSRQPCDRPVRGFLYFPQLFFVRLCGGGAFPPHFQAVFHFFQICLSHLPQIYEYRAGLIPMLKVHTSQSVCRSREGEKQLMTIQKNRSRYWMPLLYFALFDSLEHGRGVADVKALSKKVAPKGKVEELPPIASHSLQKNEYK